MFYKYQHLHPNADNKLQQDYTTDVLKTPDIHDTTIDSVTHQSVARWPSLVSVRTASSAEGTQGSASSLGQPSFSTVLHTSNVSASTITNLLQRQREESHYLVRMRLTTCASLHRNTRIQPSHASLRRSIEGSHVCSSCHSWHPHHRLLLHLPWH